jgi:hypothetical protein
MPKMDMGQGRMKLAIIAVGILASGKSTYLKPLDGRFRLRAILIGQG